MKIKYKTQNKNPNTNMKYYFIKEIPTSIYIMNGLFIIEQEKIINSKYKYTIILKDINNIDKDINFECIISPEICFNTFSQFYKLLEYSKTRNEFNINGVEFKLENIKNGNCDLLQIDNNIFSIKCNHFDYDYQIIDNPYKFNSSIPYIIDLNNSQIVGQFIINKTHTTIKIL